ncbi:MAG: hypothetical protein SR1Q7_05345 [Quinella sp. 1Q7]|nr:hypothetical protein [Quinella sp. 1Q7]
MTRKFFAALMMFAVLMVSSSALAAFEENIEEGANLAAVKKLAIAMPNYYKVADAEPEVHDLMRDIYNAGRLTSTLELLSYEDIAAAIRRDTGVDIFSLDVPEAEKQYNKNIPRYADAYVIATIANNSDSPWLFFYVYNAADGKLMYTYSSQSRLTGKNSKDYGKVSEEFFKQFDVAATQGLDKENRKALEAHQKEVRNQRRKMNKVTYKTGKNKVDMVRKK